MIKDAKVHVGKTQSEFSSNKSEVVINGIPMTVKEAADFKKKKEAYINQPKNLQRGN